MSYTYNRSIFTHTPKTMGKSGNFFIELTITTMVFYIVYSHRLFVECNFILFGTERTGSTLFSTLLNQNKHVQMHGEIFNWNIEENLLTLSNIRGFKENQFNKTNIEAVLKPNDVNRLMQLAFSKNKKNASEVGFKIFPEHLPTKLLVKLLAPTLQLKYIIIWRSNILESYVSWLHASSGSSSWVVLVNETGIVSGRLSHGKVSINPDLF